MSWIVEPERKTPVILEADVLVCGGGFAGVAAAVCAARQGVRVLLLERYGFLGGLVTGGLVITTPPLDNGINREIAERLRKQQVYAPLQKPGAEMIALKMHAIDPEVVKHELVEMLRHARVELLLHTLIVGSIIEESAVKGVLIENKAGRQAILAKTVVDCTGDADVAAFARAPFRVVKKPITMMFNMAGVDVDKVLSRVGNWSNLKQFVTEAVARGELKFELGTTLEWGTPGVHAECLIHPGEINVWSGNLRGMDALDPKQLTEAELITRDHVMRLVAYLRTYVPGFEGSWIELTSPILGVRATRQILGGISPNMQEVRNTRFADTVAKPYAEDTIRLPYGTLLPQGVDNLLVAGRCISAEEEAMGQLRLIPVCAATGQAAGTAAALAVREGVTPGKLDVTNLQRALSRQAVDLGL
ncbi:MAG: FAD-dependent oxidoreductase [Candidatus Methylomirabilota bacterium]|jgi:ribulose 1,5-bisphosphate synthetase/thiazole synthase